MSMTEEEFLAILTRPVKEVPAFFRLYYRDDGSPICFSMEELPHNYIDVTQEVYSRSPVNVRVADGKMIEIKPATYVKKLKPSTNGTPCDPRDVCVVVTENQKHIKWSLVHSETN